MISNNVENTLTRRLARQSHLYILAYPNYLLLALTTISITLLKLRFSCFNFLHILHFRRPQQPIWLERTSGKLEVIRSNPVTGNAF